MTKQKSRPEYVTKEILKEEISASEKRFLARIDAKIDAKIETAAHSLKEYSDSRYDGLDAKIGTTAQSLKEYVDSRFTRLDAKTDSIERTVKEQGKKMDVYFQGIVKMVEGVVGKVAIADDRLKDHEVRITAPEGKGIQPAGT